MDAIAELGLTPPPVSNYTTASCSQITIRCSPDLIGPIGVYDEHTCKMTFSSLVCQILGFQDGQITTPNELQLILQAIEANANNFIQALMVCVAQHENCHAIDLINDPSMRHCVGEQHCYQVQIDCLERIKSAHCGGFFGGSDWPDSECHAFPRSIVTSKLGRDFNKCLCEAPPEAPLAPGQGKCQECVNRCVSQCTGMSGSAEGCKKACETFQLYCRNHCH